MVDYRSGRQGERWMDSTVSWARKPHTQQERIEAWLGAGDLNELLSAREALERQGAEATTLLRALIHRDARSYREGKKQVYIGLLLIVCVVIALFCRQMSHPGSAEHIAIFLLIAFWLFFPCTLSWYEEFVGAQKSWADVASAKSGCA